MIEKAKLNNIATDELEEAQRVAREAKQQEFDAQDDTKKEKEANEKAHQKEIADIKMSELEAEAQIQQAKMGLAGQFGNLLGQIAGKNKTAAIAGVLKRLLQ